MKILYHTIGYRPDLPDGLKADYQSNLLFHGLRTLYGGDVIDYPRQDVIYKDFPNPGGLWGRGFSYSCTLDDTGVNRDQNLIINNIYNNYYDVIIFSIHHSHHNNPIQLYQTLNWLQSINSKCPILVIDGNDEKNTYNVLTFDNVTLFKREIPEWTIDPRVKPISFAIPAEKIVDKVPEKKKMLASIVPADFGSENRKSHIYTSEEGYYQGYKDSWFGITVEKGGFCSMRFLEICANGCIPIFGDIENCPPRTLCDLPKKELIEVKNIPKLLLENKIFNKHQIGPHSILFDGIDENILQGWAEFFLDYAKKNLTTTALATRVLSEIGL